MSNIINTWCDSLKANQSDIKTGLVSINNQLSRDYDHSILSAWRSGARPIPQKTFKIMLRDCLEYAVLHNTHDGIVDIEQLTKDLLPT